MNNTISKDLHLLSVTLKGKDFEIFSYLTKKAVLSAKKLLNITDDNPSRNLFLNPEKIVESKANADNIEQCFNAFYLNFSKLNQFYKRLTGRFLLPNFSEMKNEELLKVAESLFDI